MKKLLAAALLLVSPAVLLSPALAADAGYPLERAPERLTDLAALQNGAKIFVNNCLNCHSASSMRYNRLADLGLTDEQIAENLLFTGDKVGDLMTVAMSAADAKKWLGTNPPDLSVIARAKSVNAGPSGADYVYTYMRTFYRDASKQTGWDNLVYPSVGMPHVLWQDQGPRELTIVQTHQVTDDAGQPAWERVTTVFDADGFAATQTEPLTNYRGSAKTEHRFRALDPSRAAQYDRDVADLTAFLSWMAEPYQQLRKQLGVWVLLFLGLFLIVAWRLNAAFWKHVK